MKPRRLVRATTFSINWSRATVRSAFLQDRDYVARWVFEPCDVRAPVMGDASGDSFFVGQAVVLLEIDAFALQLADRLVDVVDAEVQHRIRRWFVGRLWVDQDPVSDLQAQTGWNLFELHAERFAVELLGNVEGVDRKNAELCVRFEHAHTPLIW